MRLFACVAAAVLLATSAARAASFDFTGTLIDGAGLIPDGSPLTGSLTYDADGPARAGSTSTFAIYDVVNALQIDVGGYKASFAAPAGGPEIQIGNDALGLGFDRFVLVSRVSEGLTGPAIGADTLNLFSLAMDDDTGTVIDDALDLPDTLNLSQFNRSVFQLIFLDVDGVPIGPSDLPQAIFLRGELTSFAPAAVVPLPATLPLALAGLGALLALRRRA